MIHTQSLANLLRRAPWRLTLFHSMPTHRVLWITQGQGRVILGGRRRGLGPNNLLFVPAGQGLALDAGPQLTGFVVDIEPHHTGRWPVASCLLRLREVAQQSEVTLLLDGLAREQVTDLPHREDALDAHAALLAIWLDRQISAKIDDEASRLRATDRLLAAFLADVERHHRSGDSMARYAERLGVTATHLSRACKTHLGLSAADLITQRVLHATRCLLEDTKTPAKDIATQLGFGSAAYFSRFVSTHTGRNPRALRNRAHQIQIRAAH